VLVVATAASVAAAAKVLVWKESLSHS